MAAEPIVGGDPGELAYGTNWSTIPLLVNSGAGWSNPGKRVTDPAGRDSSVKTISHPWADAEMGESSNSPNKRETADLHSEKGIWARILGRQMSMKFREFDTP